MRLFSVSILALSLISAIFCSRAEATPQYKINIKNAKVTKAKRQEIWESWVRFLRKNREVLLKPGKEYTVDHKCKFEARLDDKGFVDIESLELGKHSGNFAYNLKVVEYLKKNPLELKIKKKDKPLELEFIYLAF